MEKSNKGGRKWLIKLAYEYRERIRFHQPGYCILLSSLPLIGICLLSFNDQFSFIDAFIIGKYVIHVRALDQTRDGLFRNHLKIYSRCATGHFPAAANAQGPLPKVGEEV